MYKGPEQYLDNDANASRLMAHARLLLKLSRRFEAIAPAGFRQMSQRLCNELSQGGMECNDIDVKVQPRQIPYQSTGSTVKPISAKAGSLLRCTSADLPDGPLKTALDRLLARALIRE